jgi:Skp family chaperone for outer membrane proteins
MFKTLAAACIIIAGTAGAAFAQSSCSEPIAPVALDGSKANLKQISEASHDANQFMKQSGDYQECLAQELKAAKQEAVRKKKELDPAISDRVQSEIDENQKMKEKVGTEFQTALQTFCRKNPNADPSCQKALGGQ